MKIDEALVEEIRNSASISQVIGHFLPIIKKGHNYTAVCPFHDDHNPSLSIAEDKKIYKCFVCGKGGNVYSFVMDYLKCSFPEAVIKVAEIIGKPINIDYKPQVKKVSKYQKYYDIMQESINFTSYAMNTYAGQNAKDYLLKRGLDKDVIEYFGIGFNPGGDVLYKYLKQKEFDDADIELSGVCKIGDYGIYDVFQNRITFPIYDINGNPIAFSARSFDESQVAKYINTSETLIYHKGDVIYNYHRIKEEAKRANRLIVCEGVMDTIAMYRAGIYNVCATLGTACTSTQIKLLANITSHFVFFYDGDKAGRQATMKAVELSLSMGYHPFVITNNTNMDPDEIINSGKAKDLKDIVSKEISGIEYAFDYYRELYPFHSYSNRKAFQRKLASLINYISDEYDRNNFYHTLVSITGLPIEYEKIKKLEYNTTTAKEIKAPKINLDGLTKAEFTILKQMINAKKAVEIYRKELGCLYNEENERIADLIIDDYRKYDSCDVSRILDHIDDQKIKNLLIKIEMFNIISDEFDEDIFIGAINRIKEEIKHARLEDLKYRIKNEKYQSAEELNKFLKEYTSLVKELGGKRNG